MIIDCHTHLPAPEAICSVEPQQLAQTAAQHPMQLFAAGIHPWSLAHLNAGEAQLCMDTLRQECANSPQVVAIGETGLDTLCGASPELQLDIFRQHIALAQQLHLPLVLHVVRSAHQILAELVTHKPTENTPWIWHGFRGKPELAAQFLAHPHTYISLGALFNPATAAAIDPARLLLETDATSPESSPDIHEVARRVAAATSLDSDELIRLTSANATAIFRAKQHF